MLVPETRKQCYWSLTDFRIIFSARKVSRTNTITWTFARPSTSSVQTLETLVIGVDLMETTILERLSVQLHDPYI